MGTGQDTPEHLIPRIGNFPVSSATYTRSAAVTRMGAPAAQRRDEIPVWSPQGEPIDVGHTSAVSALAMDPNSAVVASADDDGNIFLWNARRESAIQVLLAGSGEAVRSLAFNKSGTRLAAVGAAGSLWVFDVHSAALQLGPLANLSSGSTAVAFFDHLITANTEVGHVNLLDTNNSGQTVETQSWLTNVATSYTASAFMDTRRMRLAVFAESGGPVSYDHFDDSGHHTHREILGSFGEINAIAIDRHAQYIVCGGSRGKVHVISVSDGGEVQRAFDLRDPITDVVFDTRHDVFTVSSQRASSVTLIGLAPNNIVLQTMPIPAACRSLGMATDGKTLVGGLVDGRVQVWFDDAHTISNPISPVWPGAVLDHAEPAEGVLLTQEQSWAMQGIALGELLYGTSLAPGEVTQLAIRNHTRRVVQKRVGTAAQDEQLSSSESATSELSEQEAADASEFGFGFSTSHSNSSSRQVGTGLLAGLVGVTGGGSRNRTHAETASFSMGDRSVSDEAQQRLHQSSHDRASTARQRRSSTVSEVSESESLELKTRVIANYNHMHALNFQFYELIQVYRLRTRVVDAQRLIFFPMEMIQFTPSETERTLRLYPHQTADVLRTLGYGAEAEFIELVYSVRAPESNAANTGGGGSVSQDEQRIVQFRLSRIKRAWVEANDILNNYQTEQNRHDDARKAMRAAQDAVLQDRDALRLLAKSKSESNLKKRNDLQRSLKTHKAHLVWCENQFTQSKAALIELRTRHHAIDRAKHDVLVFLKRVLGEDLTEASESEDSREANAAQPEHKLTYPELTHANFSTLQNTIMRLLQENCLAVNHHLWLSLNPAVYAAQLQGRQYNGRAITAEVDPNPVAIAGHYLGFPWHHAVEADEQAFQDLHVNTIKDLRDTVALPTGGVFGEAVLGESNVADDIDITRFWNWSESLPPIMPAKVAPLSQQSSDPLKAPAEEQVQAPTLPLGPISFPTVTSGIEGITEALTNPELFADLSGRKTSVALANSALDLSAKQSTLGTKLATENFKRHLQLQQKIADTVMEKLNKKSSGDLDPTMAGAVLNAGGGKHTGPAMPFDGGDGGSIGDGKMKFVVEDPREKLDQQLRDSEVAPLDNGNGAGGRDD